jgi:hypothetical protein
MNAKLITRYSSFKNHNGLEANKTMNLSKSKPRFEIDPKRQSLDLSGYQSDKSTSKYNKLRSSSTFIMGKENAALKGTYDKRPGITDRVNIQKIINIDIG